MGRVDNSSKARSPLQPDQHPLTRRISPALPEQRAKHAKVSTYSSARVMGRPLQQPRATGMSCPASADPSRRDGAPMRRLISSHTANSTQRVAVDQGGDEDEQHQHQ